jgi:hypothetical protein
MSRQSEELKRARNAAEALWMLRYGHDFRRLLHLLFLNANLGVFQRYGTDEEPSHDGKRLGHAQRQRLAAPAKRPPRLVRHAKQLEELRPRLRDNLNSWASDPARVKAMCDDTFMAFFLNADRSALTSAERDEVDTLQKEATSQVVTEGRELYKQVLTELKNLRNASRYRHTIGGFDLGVFAALGKAEIARFRKSVVESTTDVSGETLDYADEISASFDLPTTLQPDQHQSELRAAWQKASPSWTDGSIPLKARRELIGKLDAALASVAGSVTVSPKRRGPKGDPTRWALRTSCEKTTSRADRRWRSSHAPTTLIPIR